MLFQNKKVTFLYGSQTGNAQEVAERLWRESKRYYFTGTVQAMDEYDITNLINEECTVFVCSTTGQGEEPDNMKKFWKFLLRKNLPFDSLISLKYFVIGLGDSSYVKFNYVAKRLNKRLSQLGATMLLPIALADDQHDLGYDFTIDACRKSLWEELLSCFPLPSTIQPLSEKSELVPKWHVELTNVDNISKCSLMVNNKSFCLNVLQNERITHKDHFQDVRLLKFQTNGEEYQPGDVFYVFPKNSANSVKEFFEVLESNEAKCISLNQETKFVIKSNCEIDVPTCLKGPVSFLQICEEYFDLSAVPRRYVFHVLSKITASKIEREKLEEFNTAEGQEELYNYCNRPRRNIVEVLQDFPHATKNLTYDVLFEIFTPIKPRAFSIASSFKYHRNELHLLLAVVNYRTKLKKPRLGLCSNWLAGLESGEKVYGWIKRGSFRFPLDINVPVILVGPGTGLAPFRSYLFESQDRKAANTVLLFGCRGKEMDFHCRNDLEKLKEENKISLICAFSRDQEQKVYVQHKIEENSKLIWKLLEDNKLHIMIAGNSKNMPQSVREAFLKVCQEEGQLDTGSANGYLECLEKLEQYQTETWS